MRTVYFAHVDLRPWVVGVVSAIIATACTIRPKGGDPGGGGTGGTTSSTGGGGAGGSSNECAAKVVCEDCRPCAVAGPCADQIAACSASAACVGIDECMNFFCTGPEVDCLAQCESSNQAGIAIYRAARACVDCEVCGDPCGTAVICGD